MYLILQLCYRSFHFLFLVPTRQKNKCRLRMGSDAPVQCMARWLSFSAMLSATILLLHHCDVIANHGKHIVIATVPFLLTLGHNIYYLVRYFQRRSAVAQIRADGTDVWPTEPLILSALERDRLIMTFPAALFLQLAWGWMALPMKGVFNLWWPEDIYGMLLTAVYWLEPLVTFYTFGCMSVVHNMEDSALCTQVHKRKCKKCGILEREREAQPAFPARPRVPPVLVLIPSMILAAVFMNLEYRRLSINQQEQALFYVFAIVFPSALVHRAYFILRILYATHRRDAKAPAWPFSPLMSTRQQSNYTTGNIIFLQFYCLAAFVIAN
jgi:hypothetical protein